MKDITITLTPEAQQRYRQACDALADAEKWAANVDEKTIYGDGAESLGTAYERYVNEVKWRDEQVAKMRSSLHAEWGVMTALHSDYDGNKRIMADPAHLSWFFSYESGYHGALIFHPLHRKNLVTGETYVLPVGAWSIHT